MKKVLSAKYKQKINCNIMIMFGEKFIFKLLWVNLYKKNNTKTVCEKFTIDGPKKIDNKKKKKMNIVIKLFCTVIFSLQKNLSEKTSSRKFTKLGRTIDA